MNSFQKACIVLAIIILVFSIQVSNAQRTSSQSELQAMLRVVPKGTSVPAFEFELNNTGENDLILNLGFMLANGRSQFGSAIHLSLRDAQNKTEILDLRGPAIIAGRVDPFVVPLPKGARMILPINLAEYANPEQKIWEVQLKPGPYFLRAEYRGAGVKQANLDMQGFRVMPYWLGTVESKEISFVVHKQ